MEQGDGGQPANLGDWRQCNVCVGAWNDLLAASGTTEIELDQSTARVLEGYMQGFHGRHFEERCPNLT
jgi:hypothetical protein